MSTLATLGKIGSFKTNKISVSGKWKSLMAATALLTLLMASGPALMAATQTQINASTTAGVAWLVAQQQANGSWLGGYAADTGFALGALEHYAEKLGKRR